MTASNAELHTWEARGPAATTSGVTTSASNVLKFSTNMPRELRRLRVVVGAVRPGGARLEHCCRHVRAAVRNVEIEDRIDLVGHSIERAGRARRESSRACTRFSCATRRRRRRRSSRCSRARRATRASRSSRRASSRSVLGGSGRNGAPKQVLKVALGSVTPFSVPATFAV